MSKGKQTTLFQSWGAVPSSFPNQQQSGQPGSSKHGKPRPRKSGKVGGPPKMQVPGNSYPSAAKISGVIDLCNDSDNDEELLAAMEESLKYVDQHANAACSSRNTDSENQLENPVLNSTSLDMQCANIRGVTNDSERQNRSMEDCLFSCCKAKDFDGINATAVEDLPGFDAEAGRIWIYPTNYPLREYQLQIVRQALIENTMVTLPTGLGKTFIAAVVMFNYYRWYPTSKIVFMAPTKPLVAQQIEACHGVMGIPIDDTAEMTGW